MNLKLKSTLGVAALVLGTQAMAQITFYEGEGFRGRAFTTDRRVGDFERFGFKESASSVVVDRGRWEVCEDAGFEGRCVVVRPGSYDSLESLGLTDRISSVRPLQGNRSVSNEVPAPLATPNYEYRRRPQERVFEAPITSVRAVVGPPNQRCWMEPGDAAAGTISPSDCSAAKSSALMPARLASSIASVLRPSITSSRLRCARSFTSARAWISVRPASVLVQINCEFPSTDCARPASGRATQREMYQ